MNTTNAVTLYGFAQSTYTRTATMACIEKDVGYRLEPLDFGKASHLALHPFGKMPAMVHGEITRFETLAICMHIDAAFDGPALVPADAELATRMIQWCSASVDYLYRPVVHGLPDAGDDDREGALAAAHRRLRALDHALATTGFLAGDAISLADLLAWPMVAYACAKVSPDDVLADMAGLRRWFDTIGRRPSAEATTA